MTHVTVLPVCILGRVLPLTIRRLVCVQMVSQETGVKQVIHQLIYVSCKLNDCQWTLFKLFINYYLHNLQTFLLSLLKLLIDVLIKHEPLICHVLLYNTSIYTNIKRQTLVKKTILPLAITVSDINECIDWGNPCVNGNCTNLQGTFYCTCRNSFQGYLCDEGTDLNNLYKAASPVARNKWWWWCNRA